MSEYPLTLTASEIDVALQKAHAPDTTLTGTISSDPSLVTAGAIRTALDNLPIQTVDTVTTGITDSESHAPSSAALLDHLLNVLPNQMLSTKSLTSNIAYIGTQNHNAANNSSTGYSNNLVIGSVDAASDNTVGSISVNSSSANKDISVTLKKGGVYSFFITGRLIHGRNNNNGTATLRKGSTVLGSFNSTGSENFSISTGKFRSAIDQTVIFNLHYQGTWVFFAPLTGGSSYNRALTQPYFTVTRHGVGGVSDL